MAISTGTDPHEPISDINVTPLVDVMLVLLVIFMVTAPLIHQQVDLDLPETRSQKAVAVKETDVILKIDRKKEISIGKVILPLRNLEAKLKEIFRQKEKREIYLQADKVVPYGFVVQVMAEIKGAGIDRMGLITDPERGTQEQ